MDPSFSGWRTWVCVTPFCKEIWQIRSRLGTRKTVLDPGAECLYRFSCRYLNEAGGSRVLPLDYRSSLGCRKLVHHKRPYKIHISSGCLTLCQFSPRLKCDDYHAAPCGPSRSTILQSRFVSKAQCLWFHSLRYLSASTPGSLVQI